MKNWLPPPNAIQLTCNLRLQLQTLSTNLGTDVSLGNVVKYLQGLPKVGRSLYSEVITLVELILHLMPQARGHSVL